MTRSPFPSVFLFLSAIMVIAAGNVAGQEMAEVYGSEAADTAIIVPEDTLHADEGLLIDSIVIEPREIYDTTDHRYRKWLFRLANRLHMVTKSAVIRRELLLREGDPFSAREAEEMARNLRARYQLVDAWVETERLANGHLLVKVVTIDQWSLLGGLELNRDGNRTRIKVGFEEKNLFGYNQFVSFDWVIQEGEENYIHTKFRDSRFFGIPYSVELEYNTDPRGELKQFSFNRPFYSLEQQFSFGMTVGRQGGRHDVYEDSIRVGTWQGQADQFDLIVENRWGDHDTKFGIGTWYTYRSDRISERSGDSIDFPQDTLFHQPALLVKLNHAEYLRMKRINSFSLLEDVTLTTGIETLFGRAFNADLDGYFYDVLDVTARLGQRIGENLFFADHQHTYWYKGDNRFRTRTRSTARFYNNSLSFMTLAMRLQYRTDFFDSPNDPLILGGTSGLRGYDEYALSGDRSLAVNVETRWFPGIEFLSAMLGGAIYADLGKAWKQNETFAFQDMEYSVGAGLRISLERATRSEIIRIDVAYTRQGHLALAFATGQYF